MAKASGNVNACQGLPTGPCPENRCDATVKYGIYDLFLCHSCEESRDAADKSVKKGRTAKKQLKAGTAGQSMVYGQSSQPGQTGQKTVQATDCAGISIQGATAAATATTTANKLDCVTDDLAIDGEAGSANGPTHETTELHNCDIVINELLAYVGFYRNCSNIDALRGTVISFYSPGDVTRAKRVLSQKFGLLLSSCPLLAERRNSTARSARDAEVDDIIGIFHVLDAQGALSNTSFVAAKLDNIPKFGPEEVNVAYVIERQAHVEATLNNIATTVQQLSSTQALVTSRTTIDNDGGSEALKAAQSTMTELNRKFDEFTSMINSRLDQAQTTRHTASAAHGSSNGSSNVGLNDVQTAATERQRNIIIFGVPENRDAAAWRRNIDDILHFVVGYSVDVSDMFRLGRYDPNKCRPILANLRTIWDKRLILNKRSKLRTYSQHGVFINSDEPVEARRAQTIERLRYKAQRDVKQVRVEDGVLYIDEIAVFSLRDGSLNNVRNG